ncbi:MAG: SIS domain-containing protein [Clostridia bacterium]|nr:SIS domain-containing protein [Clostridia bacterium]
MNISERMKRVMQSEGAAIAQMAQFPQGQYDDVVNLLASCKGKIVFMGVGKSGHIGKKLAATFSSTGTPSFFVHSTEACHGDFGMIERQDIAVLISNSGNTREVTQTIPFLKNIGCKTIALTSNIDSDLAKGSDLCLLIPKTREADDLDLAPTVSSTVTLALGDAIACTLSTMKGFNRNDFYKYHPGGALGDSLHKEGHDV